jgi:hypothetical protein
METIPLINRNTDLFKTNQAGSPATEIHLFADVIKFARKVSPSFSNTDCNTLAQTIYNANLPTDLMQNDQKGFYFEFHKHSYNRVISFVTESGLYHTIPQSYGNNEYQDVLYKATNTNYFGGTMRTFATIVNSQIPNANIYTPLHKLIDND